MQDALETIQWNKTSYSTRASSKSETCFQKKISFNQDDDDSFCISLESQVEVSILTFN